jgi:hypothetical protein
MTLVRFTLGLMVPALVGSIVGSFIASQSRYRCTDPTAHIQQCLPGRQPIVNPHEDMLRCDDSGHWILTKGVWLN